MPGFCNQPYRHVSARTLEGRRFTVENPEALALECIESDCRSLLLDRDDLPSEFFDLSNGALGALLHRLGLYGITLAVVVPDVQKHSEAFQAFVREANRGRRFRFFPGRPEAIAWLDISHEEGP